MKEKLLEATREHAQEVARMQKRINRYSGNQIQSGSLLTDIRTLASVWFDRVKPMLERGSFSPEKVTHGTDVFDRLLRAGKMKPRKGSVVEVLSEGTALYRDIIHQIEISSYASAQALSIAPFVEGLTGDEVEYLDEAQRCLSVDGLKACAVLGWCATISRIQKKIEQIGYDVFSKATVTMHGKTTGRFKAFRKQFQVESLSDLQTVFDTDLLWVLEFLELIDSNQHGRLRHCFELRNNSAHPGLAPIKGPNLYSFYSDISEIVLNNPKFALA